MLTPKQYRFRGMGRYIVCQMLADGTRDIYRGAKTEDGARKARREISHWPNVVIYDQAEDRNI